MRKWIGFLVLLMALAACSPPESAPTVTLVADGETRTLTTEALTVRDLLVEANVALDENDRVAPAEPTLIEDGMTIRVTRVETRTEVEEREIPFGRRTVRDATIPEGETQLLESGIMGLEEITYRITIEDGIEVDRQVIKRETVREPRTEVLLVGARAERKAVPITGTVAYAADRNAWVMQSTSLNQRQLTSEGDLDERVFALSSDGSHLLFTRIPTATEPLTGTDAPEDGPPLNTLWAIDATAADAEPVRLDVDGVLWAAWEPDCAIAPTRARCSIAYATGERAEGNPGWKANNDLWMARPRLSDGRLFAPRRVVAPGGGGAYGWWGTTYAWSPDGNELAYARTDEVGLIRVYDGRETTLAGFAPYRTYAPWAWAPTISWSSDGAFIVTTLHGPGPTGERPEESPVFDVWALSSDGAITAELVSEAGMWAAPTYAPAGDQIAFGRARSPYASQSSGYDLYLMDADGSDRRHVFPPQGDLGLEYPEVAWGPQSERLIVVYQGNLYMIELIEDEIYQLTDDGGVAAVRWRW
jgi:Tol biopolymer transport system component